MPLSRLAIKRCITLSTLMLKLTVVSTFEQVFDFVFNLEELKIHIDRQKSQLALNPFHLTQTMKQFKIKITTERKQFDSVHHWLLRTVQLTVPSIPHFFMLNFMHVKSEPFNMLLIYI